MSLIHLHLLWSLILLDSFIQLILCFLLPNFFLLLPPSCNLLVWQSYFPILCIGFKDRDCISGVLVVTLNCLHAYCFSLLPSLYIKHYTAIFIHIFPVGLLNWLNTFYWFLFIDWPLSFVIHIISLGSFFFLLRYIL